MGGIVLWSWCPMDFVVPGQYLSAFILGCSFDHLLLAAVHEFLSRVSLVSLWFCELFPVTAVAETPVPFHRATWRWAFCYSGYIKELTGTVLIQFTFKRNDRNNVSITWFAKLPVFKYWQINQFRGKLYWFVCTIELYVRISSVSETKPVFYSVSTVSQFITYL